MLAPPLALLILAAVAAFILAWLLFSLSGLLTPAMIASGWVAMLGITIVLAWVRCGRGIISFAPLL